jgi:hypothetical protein
VCGADPTNIAQTAVPTGAPPRVRGADYWLLNPDGTLTGVTPRVRG